MRKLTWFACGFTAACLCSCFLWDGLFPAGLCAALALTALAGWLRQKPKLREGWDLALFPRRRRIGLQVCRRALAACLGAAVGFLWFSCFSALFLAPAQAMAGTEQTISGTAAGFPTETSVGGYSVILRLDGDFRSPDVLLYGEEELAGLRPGDRVTCTAELVSSDLAYGDETTYYTARGLFLIGYCRDDPVVEAADRVPPGYWPALCANALREGIYAAFDGVAAPLAAAVTLGDKSGLGSLLTSALNRSGVMHAAVVSGMHVGFLVSVLLLLCRGRRDVALCLVPLLFFYALMAGGTPSAIRAAVMQTVLLLGFVLRRDLDVPSSMGLALLVLLIQNPYAVASVSLQLSFASVAGIACTASPLSRALLEPVRRRIPGTSRAQRLLLGLWRAASSSAAVSLGAMLFTTPLILLYFKRVALIGPLTNLLVLWAVTALMVCALFVGTLAVFLPGLAAIPGAVCGLLARYVRLVVTFLGRLPLASLDGSDPYFLIWLAALYLVLLTLCFARRKKVQSAFALLCLTVLLGLAVRLNALSVQRADLTVTVLDVGQGACTLLTTPDSAVLVDCGGSASSSAGDLAADRLAAAGASRLDAVVFTHLDDDHCNGMEVLFWRLDIQRVYLPEENENREQLALLLELAEQEGAEVTFLTDTLTFSMGSAQLTLYPAFAGGTSNEAGLFALASHGAFDLLITGDADSFRERMLLKYYPIPDLEVLLVGHHGSAYSTCGELLEALRPETAVISVGRNSYGHPTQAVLDRLDAAGAQVLRTDRQGTVTIRLRQGQVSIS